MAVFIHALPMIPALAESLAQLHHEVFPQEESWTVDSFMQVGQMPAVFCLIASEKVENGGQDWECNDEDLYCLGIIMGSIAEDEAEVLTFAVRPYIQGRGVGKALLAAFEEYVRKRRVEKIYLEVAEQNMRAKGIYLAFGYQQIGIRKGYYATGANALVMAKIWAKEVL